MKKRFFILIASCFVFTCCISVFKTEPNEKQINVYIVNSSPWELKVRVQRGYGFIGIPVSFRLGKESKKLILQQNATYTLTITSRLDTDPHYITLKTYNIDETWHIKWDSFYDNYTVY